MIDNRHFEVDLVVRDATSEHTIHREFTSVKETPQEVAGEILGALYAGVANRLKPVTSED